MDLIDDKEIEHRLHDIIVSMVMSIIIHLALYHDMVNNIEEIESPNVLLPRLVLEKDVVDCAFLFLFEQFRVKGNILPATHVSLVDLIFTTDSTFDHRHDFRPNESG